MQSSGWTLHGYNFCGPGNTLNYYPTRWTPNVNHELEYC